MRFFTTLHKAGRLEYFLVNVALGAFLVVLFRVVLQLEVTVDTTSPEAAQASFNNISYSQTGLPLFLVGAVVYYFAWIINTCRRLKDLNTGYVWALLLFVPLIGLIFGLWLHFASGISDKTYTPYGDDPYDPNSWVPPEASTSNGPSISQNGEAIYLPGEDAWGQGQNAA